MRGILKRFKSVSVAFIPVVLSIVCMMLLGSKFSTSLLVNFAIGIFMVIIGEVVFLQGIDSSIMNMGEIVGNSSNKISKFFILVLFGLIFGLFASMAEPSVQVLAIEAVSNGLHVPKMLFVFVLAFGTGVFIAMALIRIVTRWNYKVLAIIFYLIIFIVTIFVPENFIAIAFDGGGASISEVAAPFLLALAAGIARNKAPNNKDSREVNFGLIGIASMGPVLSILVLSLFFGVGGASTTAESATETSIWISEFFDICLCILPLVFIFFTFQAIFIKIPKSEKIRIILGTIVTFFGLYFFMVGIELGFLDMGKAIGADLLKMDNILVSVAICMVLALALCFCEPAVAILAHQVEDLTNGNIKSGIVMIAIAIGFSFAVMLALLKIAFNLSVFTVLLIGYSIVFILMLFTSKTFSSIAFDSGGVAAGTMTSSFIMPIMIGFAGIGNEINSFGVLSFVALTPIIIMEVLGIIFEIKTKSKHRAEHRRKMALDVAVDELSNISQMELKYAKIKRN